MPPELTTEQLVLLSDLKDDIEYYREELDDNIRTYKILLYAAIGAAIIGAVLLVVFPDLLDSLKELSENLGLLAGLATETIPLTFATKSFNKGSNLKKKKRGLRVFEKDINRMEMGVIPNATENILSIEQELIRYINT